MSNIVGIGANVYDTLMVLPDFPPEDTKLKADSVKVAGGGPCATGLVAASKLGATVSFIGAMTDDDKAGFLIKDFEKYNVSTDLIEIKPGFDSFFSVVMLNKQTASRTIVFHRGTVPKLALSDNQKEAVKNANVLMVDGNELDAAIEGAKIAKENGTKVLLDAGGLYEGIEKLVALTDILIPSYEFALGLTKTDNDEDAAKILFEKYHPEIIVITNGKEGGMIYDGKKVTRYPAFLVDAVDSNGSGDVFHGAFAFSVNKGYNYYDSAIFSSAVSALKCTKMGSRAAVPTYEETLNFLKERGYDEFEKNLE